MQGVEFPGVRDASEVPAAKVLEDTNSFEAPSQKIPEAMETSKVP